MNYTYYTDSWHDDIVFMNYYTGLDQYFQIKFQWKVLHNIIAMQILINDFLKY